VSDSWEQAAARVDAVFPTRALAELLATWCLEVEPGQRVVARSTALATPLMIALQEAILAREAWPTLEVELPGQAASFYRHARDAQLDDYDELAMATAKSLDSVVSIQAPYEPRELAEADPARIARAARGRRPVRERTLKKRWCSTLWPTPAGAQLAGMELEEFAGFVAAAMFLDRPDPAAAWQQLGRFQAALAERLARVRELRIEAPGTDLTLSVRGRSWVNSDGQRNMPSGEVFTGPVEASAEGRITFTIPSAPAGVEVTGVELVFREGRVVESRAAGGGEYLRRALATDEGASRLGEIGIGTNFGIDRPVGAILFDEKIGGTVHLALGRSYPETGGRNESALHWDLICDLRHGGRLLADGEELLVDGRFT